MPLKIRVPNPSTYSGAVLPNVPTERQVVESLPGLLGYFDASDRGATGTVWNARYGAISFTGAPVQGTQDGLPVVPFVNATTLLTMAGFAGFAAMTGFTWAAKLWMPEITQSNKYVMALAGGAGNPRLTAALQTGSIAWGWRNSANVAVNRNNGNNGPRWYRPFLTKDGTTGMRSKYDAEALASQEADGTALGATNWTIGGTGGNGVPAMAISKMVCLQSGNLSPTDIANINTLMA